MGEGAGKSDRRGLGNGERFLEMREKILSWEGGRVFLKREGDGV